jgi:hypothetical protein
MGFESNHRDTEDTEMNLSLPAASRPVKNPSLPGNGDANELCSSRNRDAFRSSPLNPYKPKQSILEGKKSSPYSQPCSNIVTVPRSLFAGRLSAGKERIQLCVLRVSVVQLSIQEPHNPVAFAFAKTPGTA